MFDQYSYKQKFSALLIIFFMLAITAYKRSFSQLIQTYKEHKLLSEKVNDFNKKSNKLDALTKDVALMDRVIGKAGESKEVIQQEIISFASEKHPEVSINDLQPIHVFSDDDYKIVTNQLDVTGNANQLLRLAYDFEKEFSYSRIVSMNYYTTKKNNKTEVLHLKMIFQNYENTK
jgi:hypothetical protein